MILAEHPDYLFAIINQANKFIDDGEYSKVPGIIGETIEIKALYPDRDLFHLAEVTGYYKLAVRYYSGLQNQEMAKNRLEILQKIAPNRPHTEQAESFLFGLGMKNALAHDIEKRTNKEFLQSM